MRIHIADTPNQLGQAAAEYTANIILSAIALHGKARIVLSTGASQFETLDALVKLDIDWSRVEAFHLDEYIGIDSDHSASFRRYLRTRFAEKAPGVHMHYIDPTPDVSAVIANLTEAVRSEPIHVALIGIGENAHIAFNDPPANFDTEEAYVVADLDERCKAQQVGEGWFPSVAEVPKQAITMTVYQIMQSEVIVSCVPHRVKAPAIQATLQHGVTNQIPATMLKTHPDYHLFLDRESASGFVQF